VPGLDQHRAAITRLLDHDNRQFSQDAAGIVKHIESTLNEDAEAH
jgi:hypothetical protein